MQSQFEVEIGNEDIFDVFIFRRKLYVKGGHDLITH